MHVRR